MLVIITAVFALCWFPAHFYHMLLAYRLDVHKKLPHYIMALCFALGHANSAVNPWLYMMLNEKFRIALSATLHGRGPRMRAGSNRSQSITKYTSIKGGNSFKTRRSKREKSKAETYMWNNMHLIKARAFQTSLSKICHQMCCYRKRDLQQSVREQHAMVPESFECNRWQIVVIVLWPNSQSSSTKRELISTWETERIGQCFSIDRPYM